MGCGASASSKYVAEPTGSAAKGSGGVEGTQQDAPQTPTEIKRGDQGFSTPEPVQNGSQNGPSEAGSQDGPREAGVERNEVTSTYAQVYSPPPASTPGSVQNMSVAEMRSKLQQLGVDSSHVLEKSELRALLAAHSQVSETPPTASNPPTTCTARTRSKTPPKTPPKDEVPVCAAFPKPPNKQTRAELGGLSVKELRSRISELGISTAGVVEKKHLVDLLCPSGEEDFAEDATDTSSLSKPNWSAEEELLFRALLMTLQNVRSRAVALRALASEDIENLKLKGIAVGDTRIVAFQDLWKAANTVAEGAASEEAGVRGVLEGSSEDYALEDTEEHLMGLAGELDSIADLMQKSSAESVCQKLPLGWRKKESRSQPGNFYYFNKKTGELCWEIPDSAWDVAEETLPPGWEKTESKNYPGRFYYFHRETRKVTWELPKPTEDGPVGTEADETSRQTGDIQNMSAAEMRAQLQYLGVESATVLEKSELRKLLEERLGEHDDEPVGIDAGKISRQTGDIENMSVSDMHAQLQHLGVESATVHEKSELRRLLADQTPNFGGGSGGGGFVFEKHQVSDTKPNLHLQSLDSGNDVHLQASGTSAVTSVAQGSVGDGKCNENAEALLESTHSLKDGPQRLTEALPSSPVHFSDGPQRLSEAVSAPGQNADVQYSSSPIGRAGEIQPSFLLEGGTSSEPRFGGGLAQACESTEQENKVTAHSNQQVIHDSLQEPALVVSTPSVLQPQKQGVMTLRVPAGAQPGNRLEVVTSIGEQIVVEVPKGANPGMELRVELPTPVAQALQVTEQGSAPQHLSESNNMEREPVMTVTSCRNLSNSTNQVLGTAVLPVQILNCTLVPEKESQVSSKTDEHMSHKLSPKHVLPQSGFAAHVPKVRSQVPSFKASSPKSLTLLIGAEDVLEFSLTIERRARYLAKALMAEGEVPAITLEQLSPSLPRDEAVKTWRSMRRFRENVFRSALGMADVEVTAAEAEVRRGTKRAVEMESILQAEEEQIHTEAATILQTLRNRIVACRVSSVVDNGNSLSVSTAADALRAAWAAEWPAPQTLSSSNKDMESRWRSLAKYCQHATNAILEDCKAWVEDRWQSADEGLEFWVHTSLRLVAASAASGSTPGPPDPTCTGPPIVEAQLQETLNQLQKELRKKHEQAQKDHLDAAAAGKLDYVQRALSEARAVLELEGLRKKQKMEADMYKRAWEARAMQLRRIAAAGELAKTMQSNRNEVPDMTKAVMLRKALAGFVGSDATCLSPPGPSLRLPKLALQACAALEHQGIIDDTLWPWVSVSLFLALPSLETTAVAAELQPQPLSQSEEAMLERRTKTILDDRIAACRAKLLDPRGELASAEDILRRRTRAAGVAAAWMSGQKHHQKRRITRWSEEHAAWHAAEELRSADLAQLEVHNQDASKLSDVRAFQLQGLKDRTSLVAAGKLPLHSAVAVTILSLEAMPDSPRARGGNLDDAAGAASALAECCLSDNADVGSDSEIPDAVKEVLNADDELFDEHDDPVSIQITPRQAVAHSRLLEAEAHARYSAEQYAAAQNAIEEARATEAARISDEVEAWRYSQEFQVQQKYAFQRADRVIWVEQQRVGDKSAPDVAIFAGRKNVRQLAEALSSLQNLQGDVAQRHASLQHTVRLLLSRFDSRLGGKRCMASAADQEAAARKWEAGRPDVRKRLADVAQDVVDFTEGARKQEANLWLSAEEELKRKTEEEFAPAKEAFTKAGEAWRLKKRQHILAESASRLRAAWLTCHDLEVGSDCVLRGPARRRRLEKLAKALQDVVKKLKDAAVAVNSAVTEEPWAAKGKGVLKNQAGDAAKKAVPQQENAKKDILARNLRAVIQLEKALNSGWQGFSEGQAEQQKKTKKK